MRKRLSRNAKFRYTCSRRNVPIEEVAETIGELMREGKVLRWGMCEVNAEIIRKTHAVRPLTAIQSEYHLMWREPEKRILPLGNAGHRPLR